MKANHNGHLVQALELRAVVNISKIQNESKSQRTYSQPKYITSCCQYFKDTK